MKKILILFSILALVSCRTSIDETPNLAEIHIGESVEGVVLVDFYADWCGPCQMMSPKVEELKKEMEGRAKIVKIDCDKSSVDEYLRIESLPTFIVFKNGKPVRAIKGYCFKSDLKELIKIAEAYEK